MKGFLRTVFTFAALQIRRMLRDPVTVLIFLGLPLILLVVFGVFLGTDDEITVDLALINKSESEAAREFAEHIQKAGVFELFNGDISMEEAREKLREGEFAAVVLLPEKFGLPGDDGMPRGKITLYYDQTDEQSARLVSSVINSVIQEMNQRMIGIDPPLELEQTPVQAHSVPLFNNLFAMFTGLAVMMVGILGVATTVPHDKKSGIYKRLHSTPFKSSQLLSGIMIAYSLLGLAVVLIMSVLAVAFFGLEMHGSWLTFALLMVTGILVMVGIGLAISGIAKNATQADAITQIFFFTSLALGGIWIPREFLPDIIRVISMIIPLAPVVDGIQYIVNDGASLLQILPQFSVIVIWLAAVSIIGTKTFSWE